MRVHPGAALAVLTLFLWCLCVASTEAQQDANSQAVLWQAGRGVREAERGERRGGHVGVEGSDGDYLVNEQRAFRNNTSNKPTDSYTRSTRLTKYRSGDRERIRRHFGNTWDEGFAPNYLMGYDAIQNSILGAEQVFGLPQSPFDFGAYGGYEGTNTFGTLGTPSTSDLASSLGSDFASSLGSDFASALGSNTAPSGPKPTPSTSSAGQRWLNILAEFLKASPEGRKLLRAKTGQLLEGVDVESGQLPRPVLLLPVPQKNQDGQRPGEDDDEYHRTLLALFRATRPRAPLLPPLLLPESPRPAPAAPLPPLSSAPPPARLRFDRSLFIRAELTVFYSDYTEPYTVWYDAESGSSRVELHGGTTVLYRTAQPGGDVQRVQFVIERYGEDERRTCMRLTSRGAEEDRAPPGLPNPEPFSFDGYRDTVGGRMERWTYTLAGQAGELGAARREALVFRHELLVARVEPDFAVPYRYRVTVDSSVLGPEVDWYEHRYLEVREQRPDAAQLRIDLERECDSLQRADRLEQVDPLREYIMTQRDARKPDTDFDKFKETYDVSYEDIVEEALRKTILIRSTRFVESANRQGASALMGVNALGVMLQAERELLQGLVDEGEDGEESEGASRTPRQLTSEGELFELGAPPSFGSGRLKPEPFPYSLDEAARLATQLPAAFSWKRQGAVTHVRNQGYCKTCWAFAVVAAVEGALFLRTGQLVPLSEQQLADCARGPHSCERGNHVRNPYQRIRDSGVVALGDYPRYQYFSPMVAQCRKEDSPVTYISGFVRVTNSSDALKVAIARHGPNVAEVDSKCDGFRFFDRGVLIDKRCNPNARNHAVTAIGFGRHKTYGNYFIVKNSWGLAGNRGYVHLHADSNTAGVHTAPSYPLLAEDDVPDRRRLSSLTTQYPDESSLFMTSSKEKYQEFLREQKEDLEKISKTNNQRPSN